MFLADVVGGLILIEALFFCPFPARLSGIANPAKNLYNRKAIHLCLFLYQTGRGFFFWGEL